MTDAAARQHAQEPGTGEMIAELAAGSARCEAMARRLLACLPPVAARAAAGDAVAGELYVLGHQVWDLREQARISSAAWQFAALAAGRAAREAYAAGVAEGERRQARRGSARHARSGPAGLRAVPAAAPTLTSPG